MGFNVWFGKELGSYTHSKQKLILKLHIVYIPKLSLILVNVLDLIYVYSRDLTPINKYSGQGIKNLC